MLISQIVLVREWGHLVQHKYTLAKSYPTWISQKEGQKGGNSQKGGKRKRELWKMFPER